MWKKVTGILVICAALITSGFILEDRYNNQNDHDKDIVHERKITTLELDKVEYQLVMNLKQFQKEQKVSLKAQKRESDYRYYTGVLNDIKRQMSQLRQDIRRQPNNVQLRNDYKYLQQQERQVQDKLNQLMSSN